MLRYRVKLIPEDGNVLVSFPDFPNVHTFGNDEGEAFARAVDALETMLMAIIEDKEAIPKPKPIRRRERFITLPALTKVRSICIGRCGRLGSERRNWRAVSTATCPKSTACWTWATPLVWIS